MQEFDELKHIWQQGTPTPSNVRLPDVSKASAQAKVKLQNEQRNGAISLLLTALFIAGLAIWGDFDFKHWYTYGAMVLVCMICLAQAAILFYSYRRLKQIDQTAPPTQHLRQWETYYAYRQQLLKWNNPLYFVLLNLALGLYFLEVLAGASTQFLSIFGIIYAGWMTFAYFIMGRRIKRREKKRLDSILDELRVLVSQFKE